MLRKVPLRRKTPLRARKLYRPPVRADDDRVTPDLAAFVLKRDGPCLAAKLGEPGCWGRTTFEHVKSQSRMGDRAESDPQHLVALCEGHTEHGMKAGYQWNTDARNRERVRDYLRNQPAVTRV